MIADRLAAALRGRNWWMRLKREFDVDDGVYVVLLPEEDMELNEQALLHIDDLAAHRRARGIVVVSDQKWVLENAPTCCDKVLSVVKASEREIDDVLSLFELYGFTERLLIVSLTRPFGSKLYNVAGIHGVTKEELVCYSIFRIRDWVNTEEAHG